MVQLANPFSLLAEKHVNDGAAEENAAKASFLAAEKKEKEDKKKQKHRPRRRPSSSSGTSLKSSNGSQSDSKGIDSVLVSSSTSLNDAVDQTRGRNNEEAIKEADLDAEGWQLVQYKKKKGIQNGNHGQTQVNEGAILNNQVNVKEGIKQLQEVAKGMIGNQGIKPKKQNMNGSARRRLQKNKAGASQDQQVKANNEMAHVASPDATEIAPVEKKLTVTYTLEEYEMMKINDNINKFEKQDHQSVEKDKSYKGRSKQQAGNKFNGDIEDVSPAIVEKVDDTFTMNPGEFPILGNKEEPCEFPVLVN